MGEKERSLVLFLKSSKTIKKVDSKKNIKREEKSKKRNLKTLQELININDISDNYILTHNYRYYIKLLPKNLNILTTNKKAELVENLKTALTSCNVKSFEFLVVDKTERLEDNINYLNELKAKNSNNSLFKELLEDDIQNFNVITGDNNSSREFFIIVTSDSEDEEKYKLINQALISNGFDVELTKRNDLKNMLQVYFERNFSNVVVRDFDI